MAMLFWALIQRMRWKLEEAYRYRTNQVEHLLFVLITRRYAGIEWMQSASGWQSEFGLDL